uniref:Uncharacterized protein n=1 Tax=Schistocephalus solidus TaxID=70667 RepID=A0A0X3Q365_SCHSO
MLKDGYVVGGRSKEKIMDVAYIFVFKAGCLRKNETSFVYGDKSRQFDIRHIFTKRTNSIYSRYTYIDMPISMRYTTYIGMLMIARVSEILGLSVQYDIVLYTCLVY